MTLGLLTQYGIRKRAGGGGGSGYTYYRLNITANNGDSRTGLSQIEFYTSPGGSNVATNSGTATASGTEAGGGSPDNLFDGSPGSAVADQWRVVATSGWVQKQFDTPFELDSFALRGYEGAFPERAPKAFQMLGSNDGSTWDTLSDRFGQGPTGGAPWGDAEQRVFTVGNTPVYYRWVFTANNGDSRTSINELELYLAIGGATVHRNAGDITGPEENNSTLGLKNAFDGTTASWRVVSASPTVTKHFDEDIVVVQYGIANGTPTTSAAGRAPKDWTLQRSTDGSSWTTVSTVAGETAWTAGELRKFTI